MSPITAAKSQSPSNTTAKATAEPQKATETASTKAEAPTVLASPVLDTKPTEAPAPEPQALAATGHAGKADTRTILSLTIDESLARKVRLLSKIEGVTISNLVIAFIEKTVPARLKAALAAIVED